MKILGVVIGLLISVPAHLYLLHEILERVQATDLMWFMFYAYVPAAILGAAIMSITRD